MRTVCPSCLAAYDVPASVLAAGRTLRCARCATDFTPHDERAESSAKPAPTPIAATPAYVSLAPRIDPPATRESPPPDLFRPFAAETTTRPANRRRPAVMAGWLASFALLGAMAWSFISWRTPIMHAWPASTRLYAVLGLI